MDNNMILSIKLEEEKVQNWSFSLIVTAFLLWI